VLGEVVVRAVVLRGDSQLNRKYVQTRTARVTNV
jgi:hypothetical protein